MSGVCPGDMEPGPMLEPVHVLTFLSAEEREEIPDAIRTKVALSFEELTRKYHNNINQKQKDRIAYEGQLKALETQLKESRESCIVSKEELEVERRVADDHLEKYRNSLATITQLEQSLHNVQSNVVDDSSKVTQLTAEKEELVGILNKRIEEIDEMNEEKKALENELRIAKAAKVNAILRADEIVSKKIQIEYKEKEVEREREWVGKQVQLLNAELERKNQEILSLQGDTTTQLLNHHAQLVQKNQELHECELSLVKVKGLNATQETQIERLVEKLREADSQLMELEEKYRLELESQSRLCSLYRETSEESQKKVDELESALKSLQGLLNLATERYGEIETQFNVAAKSYQEEVTRRETSISKLEIELRQANDLLQSFNEKGLTQEMIESLSPSAAVVCKFLQGTFSLTEIYSKLTSSEEELGRLHGENTRLNESLAKIVNDIASRTPALKAQKENYEAALETIDALSSQLDLAMEAEANGQREIVFRKQSYEVAERENNRLQSLLRDNASQINVLLREIETLRGTYTSDVANEEEMMGSGIIDSARLISTRLVTFRNIEDLQKQNSYLLALVRELTEERENRKEKPKEEVSSVDEYKEAYEVLRKEVTELKELRLKQEEILLSTKEHQRLHSSSRDGDGSTNRYDTLSELQSSYAELKEDFESYRREKVINDQLALEELEKCRDEASRLRSENAKLNSQTEYGKERDKIYSANLQSFNKTIESLEERNGNLNLALAKQENVAHFLRDELLLTNEKLARAEVSVSSLTAEVQSLKETKVRVEMQLELYKREERMVKSLESNFLELKLSLEMRSKKAKAQLEAEVETLQNEVRILRKKSQSEAEELKCNFNVWENSKSELEAKLSAALKSEEKLKSELFTADVTVRRQGRRIDQLLQKVNAATIVDSDVIISQHEEQLQPKTAAEELLHSRIGILEEQVRKKDEEVTLLSNSCVEWERLGKALEVEVRLSNRSLTEEKLRCKDEMIRELQSKIDSLEKGEVDWKGEKEKVLSDVEKTTSTLEARISQLMTEIESIRNELEAGEEKTTNLEEVIGKSEKRVKELEARLSEEVSHHAVLLGFGKERRLELETAKEEVNALMQEKTLLTEEVERLKQRSEEREHTQEDELSGLRITLKELEGVNGNLQEELLVLHDTLQKGTQELERSFGSNADNSDEEEETRSSKHWTQLLRYMRRQKEIAFGKIEKGEAKILRLESQLNYAEKQLKEVSQAYATLQADSKTSVFTSSKTQELMEKIETLGALTDSNMLLREKGGRLSEELETMKKRAKAAEDELIPFTKTIDNLKTKVENMESDNLHLREELSRWKTRANALIEKTNKFNFEEMKRVSAEKEALAKELSALEGRKEDWEEERSQLQEEVSILQGSTAEMETRLDVMTVEKEKLVEDVDRVNDEKTTLEIELEKTQGEIFLLKEQVTELTSRINNEGTTNTSELESVQSKLKKTTEELEENKATVKHLKNIARRYKKYYEDSIKEGETPQKPIDEGELPEGVEVSSDSRLQELTTQNETLRKDLEVLRIDTTNREERAKVVLKTMRDRVSELSEEKIGQEAKLNLAKTKVTSLEGRSEEVNIRLAAMKSQYEGRLNRLEKENKEMKDSDINRNNEELKKELSLQRQRILVLEKQLILKNSGEGQTSGKTAAPGDKTHAGDPPKANIKPIAGPSSATKQTTQIVPPSTSRPQPTASIRPMAMTRKATVLPTTAATQAQGNASSGTPSAPVSQAQVSTSTPDQSSQCTLSPLSQTTGGSTASLRQATVQPTPATQTQTTLPPPPHLPTTQTTTQEGMETPLPTQEPPSTSNSHMDSEMGDSSEQVSSSEPSSQGGGVPVALPRSEENPHPIFSEAVEGGEVVGREEPSPSTSSSRPSQSSKRSRADEVETSEEVLRDSNSKEPPLKRTRLILESVVDREAEPMGAHGGDESEEEEEEEQVPHSGRRRPPPEEEEEEEDKDSVIVLNSEEEEDEEDEEVLGEEEEEVEAVEEYDDEGDELMDNEDPEEGREAESMEEIETESLEDDEEQDEERIEGILQEGESEGEEEKSEEEVVLMDGDDFEVEMNQEAGEASPANPHMGNEEIPSLETRMPRHAERVPLQHQSMTPYHMYNTDDGDERIVPSTPTLFHPRRTDGFAEAVSSPQVSSIGRQFIFGADESRVDFHHYEEGSGRSVPTTPLQVSPPVGIGDEEEEDDAVRVEEAEAETGDGQPSSSNTNALEGSFPVTPPITLTTPFEGASPSEDDRHEPQLNTLPTESGDEVGASVTSSDEDKVERRGTAAGTSSAQGLRPKVPLASSDATSSPGGEQQRTRPTPIVWDQPTSSSASAPLPPATRGGHRGRIGMGQIRALPLPILRPPSQESTTAVRGPFRGRGQSARRSRPHGVPRPRPPY